MYSNTVRMDDAHPLLAGIREGALDVDPSFVHVAKAADGTISDDLEPLTQDRIEWVIA